LALEILFVLLLILCNGIFSGSEIAVVAARKVRLQQLVNKGSRPARVALRLAETPNDFLSTVQIGITLIGILSGAVGGATLAKHLKPVLDGIEALQPYSEGVSVTLVVVMITYLSLVIGELVPKRLALANPEQIACRFAPAMRALSRLSSPVVHLLSASTDALLRFLNVEVSTEPEITEEEIKALIRQGADSGVFEESEHDMVQRVLRLGDRAIRTMMTPRTEICWLDLEDSLEENLAEVRESNHSRFPVAQGSLDNCIGIVRVRSLLTAHMGSEPIDLSALCQAPLHVAESTLSLNVLEEFKRTGIHIALVTDEFGGVEGLVTLNDLMEGIVGDLPALEDEDEPSLVTRQDGSWLVNGSLDINEFDARIGTRLIGSIDQNVYHTLAGFVIHSLKRIPTASDYFDWHGYRFEVMDMDGNRIDKILVTPLSLQRNG
jgi:putative hemolysin